MSDPSINPELMPSADGTKVTGPGAPLLDDGYNAWRLVHMGSQGNVVQWQPKGENTWRDAGHTANVSGLEKFGDTCWQWVDSAESMPGVKPGWWEWLHANKTWRAGAGDPSAEAPPIDPPIASGEYYVADGKIIGPDGLPFIALGVNLLVNTFPQAVTGPDCKPLLDHYPQCNFVHICQFEYTCPPVFAQEIEWLTAKGIVVQIGSYATYPAVPTGSYLQQEVAWLQGLAQLYKDNPRVWFCSGNEPQDIWLGLPAGSIVAEHQAVYDAVRSQGANNINGLCTVGCTSTWNMELNKHGYMRNCHLNIHYYNWLSNSSTDLETNKQTLRNVIADCQQIRTADGIMPAGIYEYGNATDGGHIDPGAWAVVQAVLEVGRDEGHAGGAAFVYTSWPAYMGGQPLADQLLDEWNGYAMTEYGQQVAADYRGG